VRVAIICTALLYHVGVQTRLLIPEGALRRICGTRKEAESMLNTRHTQGTALMIAMPGLNTRGIV